MKKELLRFCAMVLCGWACSLTAETLTMEDRVDLAGVWSLRQADDSAQPAIPITIPGGIHSALFAAGRIPDPFFGQNEKKTQWVGQKEWIVERSVEIPASLLKRDSVILRLEDVDTYCTLSLNGQPVGVTSNRFRRYEFDVKPFLRDGENKISAFFHSAEKLSNEWGAKLPHPIPMVSNGLVPHMNLLRKPICHGGWDWGLAQMITGFAGKTELLAYDLAKLDYVMCDQKHTPGLCEVTVRAEVSSPKGGAASFFVQLGEQSETRNVTLSAGKNEVSVTIPVANPKLWWPNGAGEQPLYPLVVKIGESSLSRKIGLRSLEVVNEPDVDPRTGKKGMSIVFRVNGVNIFCKGANWIPCDAFQNRQTPERYRDLITAAADANMNMLRVWGGGQFESDCFYELCDEKGILLWHDFMFSCALYPADKAFLGEIRAELNHQLRRLRDHASIAMWCGDNECIGALGWFEPSRRNRDLYLISYDRLSRMMTDLVAEVDPSRTFWPSSPCAGPGDFSDGWHDDNKGDMHYWTVWHENKDFSAYYKVKPRFCSEFGYQSFSSPEVAATFCDPDQLNPTAPDFEYHQKNGGGNTRILETIARYFRFPEGSENILYLSQVQQAMAIRTAVEAWRHLQPRCMGILFWQLNDNWPVASWSSVEYGGKWKHLQYHAKRFYAPLSIMAVPAEGDSSKIEIWAVNDYADAVEVEADLVTWGFDGKKGLSRTLSANLPARSATLLQSAPLDSFGSDEERAKSFLSLKMRGFYNGKWIRDSNDWMFQKYKTCPLEKAEVDAIVTDRNGVWTVVLTTDKPAFFVWVDVAGIRGEFSDNSFTLYPGSPVTLTFKPDDPNLSFDSFRDKLTVKHLRQTYR